VSNSSEPRFSDLKEADLAPWRDLPVSKLLVARLKDEIEDARTVIPVHVESGDSNSARIATAYLRANEQIYNSIMHPASRPEDEPEEPFTDPAALLPQGGTE